MRIHPYDDKYKGVEVPHDFVLIHLSHNVTVYWFAHMLHIQEVICTNIGL